MPSRHRSGNFKQRNKPFKGSNKKKTEAKQAGMGVTKKIHKYEKQYTKNDRLNKKRLLMRNKMKPEDTFGLMDVNIVNNPNLKNKLIEFVNQQPQEPTIVLLVPFNEPANPELINANLVKLFIESNEDLIMNQKAQTLNSNKIAHSFKHQIIQSSSKISPELKPRNYIFISCPRNMDIFLDYCKVADVVGVVLSCKNVEQNTLVLDPFEHAKAFDEFGYQMLSCMRTQGEPACIGILQDLEVVNPAKQPTVKKIFQRFFESEFSESHKFVSLNNNDAKTYFNLMRTFQEVSLVEMEWRDMRGYLLSEKIEVDPTNGAVAITGFLKGTVLNPNQLVHVTGYGDFALSKIDLLVNPLISTKKQKLEVGIAPEEVFMSFDANKSFQDVNKFPEGSGVGGVTKIIEKNMDKAEGMETEETKMEEDKPKKLAVVGGGDMDLEPTKPNNEDRMWDENEEMPGEDDEKDISFNDDEPQSLLHDMHAEKKKIKFEIKKRAQDALEFEDELDYPATVSMKERVSKYKGLKSFRAADWGAYNNLPTEFEKIFILDDYNKSRKIALEEAMNSAVVIRGCYVRLHLTNFPANLLSVHDKDRPLIVSSLLKYEQKVSLIHMKVKKMPNITLPIRSKEELEFHIGFRVMKLKPIFSKIFASCNKTKFMRTFTTDQAVLAAAYGELTFTPANILVFKNEGNQKHFVLSGELTRAEPLKITLKRIILCGYPLKIGKRRAVCRMMFFNAKDVNYFSSIELNTRLGLRGHIQQSVGTHGLMKCIFSSGIKAHDTVCMYLYKRVFPPWPYDAPKSLSSIGLPGGSFLSQLQPFKIPIQ
jgi:pre-rRNA-processing protein TSR1